MARLNGRLVAVAIGAVVILVGAAVAISSLVSAHKAPPQLTLSSTAPSDATASLAGTWKVAGGSQVGYRVKEKFINQPAETEAVARTSKVTGSMVVAVEGGGTVRVTRMKFVVDLASLTSQDKYANYQVYQRDFFVRTVYLETNTFPTATFSAVNASLPLPASGPVTVDVPGNLNVHGVTRDVIAHVHAQGDGGQAEVAGSLSVDMRDFAIGPPDISFTRAEPQVTIEFDLKMTHV